MENETQTVGKTTTDDIGVTEMSYFEGNVFYPHGTSLFEEEHLNEDISLLDMFEETEGLFFE